ncbi:MAG: response regulator, partial [Promethearchaeota archaeon]
MSEYSPYYSPDIKMGGTKSENADPITVLHVDDEEVFLTITKSYIEKMSDGRVKIDSFSDPDQVLGQLQEKTYDVIVADYQMPSMNGLQLLEQVRSQIKEIPFIILTGRGREEIAIKALNLGADRYIKKGLDSESMFREVIHAIETVVQHKQAERLLRESETKFRSIAESSLVGLAIIQDGQIKYTSAA